MPPITRTCRRSRTVYCERNRKAKQSWGSVHSQAVSVVQFADLWLVVSGSPSSIYAGFVGRVRQQGLRSVA